MRGLKDKDLHERKGDNYNKKIENTSIGVIKRMGEFTNAGGFANVNHSFEYLRAKDNRGW